MNKIHILTFAIIFVLFCNRCNKSSVKDFSGNTYSTVKIGEQTWFKENLRTRHFNDGTPIFFADTKEQWQSNGENPAYCLYENNEDLLKKYGLLYNWFAAQDTHCLCPTGWRVATEKDYNILIEYCGGSNSAGQALKVKNVWPKIIFEPLDSVGFSAYPSGHRTFDGHYGRAGKYAFFWTAENDTSANKCADHFFNSEFQYGCAKECSLRPEDSKFLQDVGDKQRGMSIRCILK